MANYPTTLKTNEALVEEIKDGRVVDQSGDGLARVRKLHADRRGFVIQHPPLTAALKAVLDAFYAANTTGTFYFVNPHDGVTYTVAFSAAPQIRKANGGLYYMATVKLVQIA